MVRFCEKLQDSVLLRMRKMKQRKYCRSRKLKEKLNPITSQGLVLLDSVKPSWMASETVCLLSQRMCLEQQKNVMDMVLITPYFDTMKEIGATSKSSAVVIPHGPGVVKDAASQIREGLLQAISVGQ